MTAVIAAGIGALVMAFAVGVFSNRPLIEPDLSTYVLPAVARAQELGSVYVDYLDIKPPLTFAFFVPWIAIAGPSLAGLWLLYALLLTALLSGFWVLLRMELPGWAALAMFGSCAAVVVWFVMLEEFFFTTEVIGMVPVLWGLVLARRLGQHPGALAVAAWLMGCAGQVKEVFVFLPLALVPIAWCQRARARALAAVAAGWLAAIATTAAVLLWWGDGAFRAYLDVLGIKRERFPAPMPGDLLDSVRELFQAFSAWLPYLAVFALGTAGCVVAALRRSTPDNRIPAWRLSPGEWALVMAFAAAWLGFTWQSAEPSKYYAVAIVYPLYLALSVALGHGLRSADVAPRAAGLALKASLILGLLPPIAAVLWFGGRTLAAEPLDDVSRILASEAPEDRAPFDAVRGLVPPGGCLHVAYGWSATATYLYTGVPPCTRFTAPPLASATDALATELREALVARPPSVLVMDPGLMLLPSTDEGRRERARLPLDVVAKACFKGTDDPKVFVASGDVNWTRACISARLPR